MGCCELLLYEQFWLYLMEVLVVAFSSIVLSTIILHSDFEIYTDVANRTFYSPMLYQNLNDAFVPKENVAEGAPPSCKNSRTFENQFTTNESSYGVASGFLMFFACLNIVYILALIYIQTQRDFSDMETMPPYSLRIFLILLGCIVFDNMASGIIIHFGINSTCTNLPESGCYLACCPSCNQYVCPGAADNFIFCSIESPGAVARDSFKNNLEKLASANNLMWTTTVLVCLIMVLYGCIFSSRRTYSSYKMHGKNFGRNIRTTSPTGSNALNLT